MTRNVYHVYDEKVLDEVAEFTLTLEIPEENYQPQNPDGTRPVISVKVNAPTKRFALVALSQLNEEETMFDVIGTSLLGDDYNEENLTKNPDLLADKLTEVHSPFVNFEFAASAEDGSEAVIKITSPTGMLAYQGFQALTNKKRLNGLLASFMPLDDEDDYDF